MKEIIEYFLAGLIIVMFFPIFNMLVIPYLKLEERTAEQELASLSLREFINVLQDQYSRGNLTYALAGGVDLLSELSKRLPMLDTAKYSVMIKVTPMVPVVNVSATGITIGSYINGSLTALILYSDGNYKTITKPPSTTIQDGLYVYSIQSSEASTTNVRAVVAIVESIAARGAGYWFNGTVDGYPIGVVTGGTKLLRLVMNTELQGQRANITLWYYTTSLYQYSYTKYNFNAWIIFSGSSYTTMREERHQIYMANTTQGNSSILNVYLNTTFMRFEETYSCSGSNYTRCSLTSSTPSGSITSIMPIDYGAYNTVLIVVRDGKRVLATPSYPTREVCLGSCGANPPVSVSSASGYVRLGLFDYYVTVRVWRK